MSEQPLISIVLPVYNRKEYLGQAIDSVLKQTYGSWELIIADDNSEEETQSFLRQYETDPRIIVSFNPVNLGLFANLNQALRRVKGNYIVLLCSDDILLPSCLEVNLSLNNEHEEATLILSSFNILDSEGNSLPSSDNFYYDQFSPNTQLWSPKDLVPILLKYGSINGNLTGVWFKKELIDLLGGFREDWTHAGDWEWIYRIVRSYPVLISRTNVAAIRSHNKQLSIDNRTNLRSTIEVAEVIRSLLKDPYLNDHPSSKIWARHIMQFHLWLAIKFAIKGYWDKFIVIVREVDQTTGFCPTLLQLIKWLPERYRIHKTNESPLPPN